MARVKAPAGMVTIKESPTNGTKVTTAQTKDGNTYTFAGDNWVDYANNNNLDAGSLSQAITYPSYVTANEANRYLNETAATATANAKAKNPSNPGIQGTTFGAGIYDKVGKGDLINEYNRLNPNNQLNPKDYGINTGSYGTQQNRVNNTMQSSGVPTGNTNMGSYNSFNYSTRGGGYNGNGLPSYVGLSYDDLYNMYKGVGDKQASGANAIMDSIMQQYGLAKNNVNQAMDKSNKDAFVNMKIAERDLPQQMAASGVTGGLTESSLLGLRSNYGNTYADNERARINELNNLDVSAAQNIADIANTIAGYEAQALQNATSAYINQVNAMNNYNQWLYEAQRAQTQYEQNLALQQAQIAYNQAQDDKKQYDAYLGDLVNVALQTKDATLLNEALALMGAEVGVDGLTSNAFKVGNGGDDEIDLGGGGPEDENLTPEEIAALLEQSGLRYLTDEERKQLVTKG